MPHHITPNQRPVNDHICDRTGQIKWHTVTHRITNVTQRYITSQTEVGQVKGITHQTEKQAISKAKNIIHHIQLFKPKAENISHSQKETGQIRVNTSDLNEIDQIKGRICHILEAKPSQSLKKITSLKERKKERGQNKNYKPNILENQKKQDKTKKKQIEKNQRMNKTHNFT